MKTSEAFRLTKKKLWDGVTGLRPVLRGVCYAARDAGVDEIVRPIIMELIKPHAFLGEWLEQNHGIVLCGDFARYQQTRHAWVDHLIQHYKSIGD